MEKQNHPDEALIARFVWGEASRAENRTVVRHLLRSCLECREAASIIWRETEPVPADQQTRS